MTLWHSLVSQLPFAWAQYDFMRNALLAVLLVSPLFALLGSLVISHQMSFFSEAMGHAALTGLAIGVLLGVGDPLWSMVFFAVLLAAAITALRQSSSIPADTVIGLTMAAAVAVGVEILSRGGGFARYSSYLVGDILTISPTAIRRLGLLLAVVAGIWAAGFNQFLLATVSRTLVHSRGVHVWLTELVFSAVVAVVVTVSIPWTGLLVTNSLLILPAAASRNISRHTAAYVWLAVGISALSGVLGLVSSYYWDSATGATIVLYALGFFILSLFVRRR